MNHITDSSDYQLFQSHYRSDFNKMNTDCQITYHGSFNPIIGLILISVSNGVGAFPNQFQSHYRSDFNECLCSNHDIHNSFNPIIGLILIIVLHK